MNYVDNSQLILAVFKVLSLNYSKDNCVAFIGYLEIKRMSEYNKRFKIDLIFSNRYICFKYILKMVTHYSKVEELDNP